MLREAIVKLVHKENLTYEMAEGAMDEIMGGKADPTQISAFLTAMTMKGETIEEITACANGMRKHGVHMEHDKDVLERAGVSADTVSFIITKPIQDVDEKDLSADKIRYYKANFKTHKFYRTDITPRGGKNQ